MIGCTSVIHLAPMCRCISHMLIMFIFCKTLVNACSKFPTTGWHAGECLHAYAAAHAPNGQQWTWQQCARECATYQGCEFWTLQQGGAQQCRLLKNKGTYHDSGGHFEGDKDAGCRFAGPGGWVLISASKACEMDHDNVTRPSHEPHMLDLAACMQACNSRRGCMAVDWFSHTRSCNFLAEACLTPRVTHHGASSWRRMVGLASTTIASDSVDLDAMEASSRAHAFPRPAPPHPALLRRKVAFLFLIEDAILHEPVWEYFFKSAPLDAFSLYVHCDPKMPPRFGPFFRTKALAPEESAATKWGALVPSMNALLRAALTDVSNYKFVFVSSSTIPVKPFAMLHQPQTAAISAYVRPKNGAERMADGLL